MTRILFHDVGHRMMSYAEEDPLEDEVEVEGENDIEPVGDTEEEDEEVKLKGAPDADTTLLFVKPLMPPIGQLRKTILHYV